jgi:ATP-dependent Clp protease protease subunit
MLSDYVDSNSVKDLIYKIVSINMQDDYLERTIQGYKRQAIILIVNSFGGSVYDGFGLVGAIEMSATPVYTVCLGSAMSMGFIIFSAGHQRMIHELSTLMYHEVSNFVHGKMTEIAKDMEEMERLQMQYDYYILEKTKIGGHQLDNVKAAKDDWYIDAHEAVKLGIADNVILIGQQVTWSEE